MTTNMETEKINWEERHFQICLAMISGELANPRTTDVRMIALKPIIVKAQLMVDKLKEREERMKSNIE